MLYCIENGGHIMKCKKVLSVILACTLLSTNAPLSLFAETNNNISKNNVIQTGTYDDIGEHWAKEKIYYLQKYDIINDQWKNSSLFMPEEKMTRAQSAELILKTNLSKEILTKEIQSRQTEKDYFTDIATHPLSTYINLSQQYNIIAGYSDNTFRADNLVTREEFVTMLNQSQSVLQNIADRNKETPKFTDVKADRWSNKNIITCAKANIVTGYPDKTFRPKDTITRAEAYIIINNCHQELYSKYKGLVGTATYNNQAQPNITVHLIQEKDNKIIQTVKTNQYGQYRFSMEHQISQGNYMIQAEYQNKTAELKNITIPRTTPWIQENINIENQSVGIEENRNRNIAGKKDNEKSGSEKDNHSGQGNTNQKTYQLKVVSTQGGIILSQTQGQYSKGQSVSLKAKAYQEHKHIFNEWLSTDGGIFENKKEQNTTFVMPDRDTTITAEFITVREYLDDEFKKQLGLDPSKRDNDGDGLRDGFEYMVQTDPLQKDTDRNGTSDADEDYDKDGLTNLQEQQLETDPSDDDTDGDGLSDGDEVTKYQINPLIQDTDGDGLTDDEELRLGLNPTEVMTDGTTHDGEKRIRQTTSENAMTDSIYQSENPFVPSVTGEVAGDINKNVRLNRVEHQIVGNNHAIVSDAVEITTEYQQNQALKYPLELSFKCSDDYKGDLRSLSIATFSKEEGMELIQSDIDIDNRTIKGNIQWEGIYFVIDIDQFLKRLEIDVFQNINQNKLAEKRMQIDNKDVSDIKRELQKNIATTQTKEKLQQSNNNVTKNQDNNLGIGVPADHSVSKSKEIDKNIKQNSNQDQQQNQPSNQEKKEHSGPETSYRADTISDGSTNNAEEYTEQNVDKITADRTNETVKTTEIAETADKDNIETEYDNTAGHSIEENAEKTDNISKNQKETIKGQDNITENQTTNSTETKEETLSTLPQELLSVKQNPSASNKVDIVFVVDMFFYGSDDLPLSDGVRKFVQKISNDNNIDARYSLIGISRTPMQCKNGNSDWFKDAESFIEAEKRFSSQHGDFLGIYDSIKETAEGIMKAYQLDWREDANKIVILIPFCDDFYIASLNGNIHSDNVNYAVHSGNVNYNEIAKLFVQKGIVVCSCDERRALEGFAEKTGGGYVNYYLEGGLIGKYLLPEDFSDKLYHFILSKLKKKTTDTVFLDDYQIIKLTKPVEEADTNDSDGDGLTDKEELGTQVQRNLYQYIKQLLARYDIDPKYYTGKKVIDTWKYSSNPTLIDSDYDGIPDGPIDYDGARVQPDEYPKDELDYRQRLRKIQTYQDSDYEDMEDMYDEEYGMYDDSYNITGEDNYSANAEEPDDLAYLLLRTPARVKPDEKIEKYNHNTFSGKVNSKDFIFPVTFDVDYRTFFPKKNNRKYHEDLSKLGILYSMLAYGDGSIKLYGERKFRIEETMQKFGLKDIRVYSLANSYRDDDITKAIVGHRLVTHEGETKDIVVVVIRGTNGTIQEWSSNFDVGADTADYWDRNNPDWKNKKHHKGFDVAANRLDKHLQQYINRLGSKHQIVTYFTGHSRAAAVANILGKRYENKPDIKSFTYTFATPNTTTGKATASTVYNIVNKDDLVPCLPLSKWGFKRYGKTYAVSIKDNYEYDGKKTYTKKEKKETWEYLFQKGNYNSNGKQQDTVTEFGRVIPSREEIYKKPTQKDQTYVYKQEYDTEKQVRKAYENQKQKYGDRISRFTELQIVKEIKTITRPDRQEKKTVYKMGVKQNGATVMMILSDVTANKQHIFGKEKPDDRKMRGTGEDKILGVAFDIGFYVAPKYAKAKRNFIHSGADTNEIAEFFNAGGMVHTHTPASYWIIANDSKGLITKKRKTK